MEAIPVTQPSMPSYLEFCEEIKDLWDSKWLTNNGSKHIRLEEEIKAYLNTDNITLFTNGHLALEYILEALNLTGEVITTPFTFASTTNAIIRTGLTPIFSDINPIDYTINVEKIESLITDKTTAIVPVHVFGNVCNVEEIDRIAKKYNLIVLYDAAHAFGVTVNGKSTANFGDASMFSFHATKVFNTIEGGAVTYANPELKKRLDCYKNFGITSPETVDFVGGNAKMNEFQAAMGLCNLRTLDCEISKRRVVFERYMDNLHEIRGIQLPNIQEGVNSNYAYFPIVVEGENVSRDAIYEELLKQNIYARKYFFPLTSSFKYFNEQLKVNETPIAKYISEKVLTLPLYANLEIENVDRICGIIKSIIGVLK